MTAATVARTSLATSLTRYARSWGLWLLLLAGPVGARFMVARDDGSGVQIAVGKHLPVITSPVLGVSLGIVVSALVMAVIYIGGDNAMVSANLPIAAVRVFQGSLLLAYLVAVAFVRYRLEWPQASKKTTHRSLS